MNSFKSRFVLFLMLLSSCLCYADNPDSLNLRITYDFAYKQRYGRATLTDRLSLDILDDQSVCFSLKNRRQDQITDSLFALGFRDYEDYSAERKKQGVYGNSVTWQVLKNFPERGRQTVTWYSLKGFKVEEPSSVINWTLLEDDTVVAGYECQKAETTFKGRKWTAWYTLDIPLDNGPWKLGGLPGLILLAKESEGIFRFECIGIEPGKAGAVSLPKKSFENCSSKELNALMKLSYEDNATFSGKMLGCQCVAFDKNGRRIDSSKNHAALLEKKE